MRKIIVVVLLLMLSTLTAHAQVNDFTLVRNITNPDPQISDKYGEYLDVDGNQLLVGAPNDTVAPVDFTGSATLYDITTGDFLLNFVNPTPETGDEFGRGVAIGGNLVIVSAPRDSTLLPSAGTAYAYDATTGDLLYTLSDPTPAENETFGTIVETDGNLVAIRSTEDVGGFVSVGTIHMFDGATGNFLFSIVSPNPANFANFGSDLAIEGNILVLGASAEPVGGIEAGAFYIYDANTGTLIQRIANPTPQALDFYGSTVAISGDRIAIGAPNDATNLPFAGAVYIYDTQGIQLFTILNPDPVDGETFGRDVALDGTLLVVGAANDFNGGVRTGSLYAYDATTGTLIEQILPPDPLVDANFGDRLVLSGTTIAAYRERDLTLAPNNQEGIIHIYEYNNPTVTTVTVTATDAEAAENPLDNGQFTVDLGAVNNTGTPIIVSYDVTGTATPDTDYIALTGTVSIPIGQQTVTIDVVPIDDADVDPDETVIVTLTDVGNLNFVVDPAPATVIILDDEMGQQPIGRVTICHVTPARGIVLEDLPEQALRGHMNDNGALHGDDFFILTPADRTQCEGLAATLTPSNNNNGNDNNNNANVPNISIFDPAISKIGYLLPGDVGVTGERLEWITTVSNIGTVIGINVTATDTLIDALQIDRVEAPGGIVSINGQTVTVVYSRLEVGEVRNFSIFTTVLDGVEISNTACVTADNGGTPECSTGTPITALPQTGETPFWQPWVWLMVILSALAIIGYGGQRAIMRQS